MISCGDFRSFRYGRFYPPSEYDWLAAVYPRSHSPFTQIDLRYQYLDRGDVSGTQDPWVLDGTAAGDIRLPAVRYPQTPEPLAGGAIMHWTRALPVHHLQVNLYPKITLNLDLTMRLWIHPRKYRRLNLLRSKSPDLVTLRNPPFQGRDRTPRFNVSFQHIPLEIIHEVALYFEPTSYELSALLRTCRHISNAVEYRRYTSIVVYEEPGIHLMSTLISGTPTSKRYCDRVKCLWFRGWSDTTLYLNSTLLSQVLLQLDNLISFWIESNPLDTDQLIRSMKSTGVARDALHPAFVMLDIIHQRQAYSRMALPSLRTMRLTGESAILALSLHRPLKELDLNFYFYANNFPEFISTVEGSVLGRTLEILCIKMGRVLDINLAFPMIANAFPSLEKLSVEQSSVKFETVLETLAFNRQLLPRLKILAVNHRFTSPIVVSGETLPKPYPLADVMEEYLRRIFRPRPCLESLSMGKVTWSLGIGGRFVRGMVSSYPDHWKTIFGEPFLLSRFDHTLTPNYTIQVNDDS
ncbi:hypothetical protein NMY22_g901 [Coprinellus aureogranulatus]|nr:hypothetical protein NMY22_g901 [Coprinellus aureogranulatus]